MSHPRRAPASSQSSTLSSIFLWGPREITNVLVFLLSSSPLPGPPPPIPPGYQLVHSCRAQALCCPTEAPWAGVLMSCYPLYCTHFCPAGGEMLAPICLLFFWKSPSTEFHEPLVLLSCTYHLVPLTLPDWYIRCQLWVHAKTTSQTHNVSQT